MKGMLLVMMGVAVAGKDFGEQEQDLNFGSRPGTGEFLSAWVCGHRSETGKGTENADGTVTREAGPTSGEGWIPVNQDAGIVELRSGSLDYIINDPNELNAVLPAEQDAARARWNQNHFNSLFCSDYIQRYKNPNANVSGVCIRNRGAGKKWDAILEADREARELWEHFGTEEGYQKSAPTFHEPSTTDPNAIWGSGRTGPSPADWCGAYMKEMICHIAFPQFAGERLDLQRNGGFQARVRPVCRNWCEDVMDICNRREPKPYKGDVSFLEQYREKLGDIDHPLDNEFYCKMWNDGFHIARAGTGVGAGPDEENTEFCAEWEAAPGLSASLFVTLLAVVALLL